jgi:transposase
VGTLFVGDDWSEDHHDVEIVDDVGNRLAARRLPEGMAGMQRLHGLLAGHAEADDPDGVRVVVGIETDQGPWVQALLAAGYEVYAINPKQSARYRERHSMSGAKSDPTDAHVLAEIVRLDAAHHRRVAEDSELAQAVKVAARAHQSMVWDRTRQLLRLRSTLREFFPAALQVFDDLDAPEALELLAKAPDPDQAARLSRSQIAAALTRARRYRVQERAAAMQQVLRAPALRQPAPVQAAYAAVVQSQVRILAELAAQVETLGEVVAEHFGQHPDAEVIASLPGLGPILAARVLGEFGDAPGRYVDAKARKNYAGTSPITRASGRKRVVQARYARNTHLADAIQRWAFSSMRGSPGAHAYYRSLRGRNIGHQAALRQLGNRWVGILHGCLKTGQFYDETTAWAHHLHAAA